MNDVTRFPVDYDALAKGDVIPAKELSRIVGEPMRSYEYQYKITALTKEIETELWSRGKPWTVRIRNGDIVILTDAEASDYNAERVDKMRRGIYRSHRRMMAVDVAQLTTEERALHDRNAVRSGMVVAALLATRRAPQPIPVQRQHPMLPGVEGQ